MSRTVMPQPSAIKLAQQIWYPLDAKPQVHALYFQFKTQVLAENWPAALASAQRLHVPDPRSNEFWYWKLARLELFLFAGEPQKLQPELDLILATHLKTSYSSNIRYSACLLKARGFAEGGDYQRALAWHQRGHEAYWSRCGNGHEGERVEYTPVTAVWKAAALPDNKAFDALQRIRQGKFPVYQTRLQPAEQSARWQRTRARDEAGLALGSLYQRRGNVVEARRALEPVAQSHHDMLALLARTHLRQLRIEALVKPLPRVL